MQPKVTVFICTYNRAGLVGESIQSVLNQTYSDIKIVVLDNASEDNTSEVVASFSDPRLSYIRHKEVLSNGNYALDHADTEYLVIFHDDDRMFPWMIEEELKVMEANPDAIFVASSVYHDLNNNKKPRRCSNYTVDKYARMEFLNKFFQRKNGIIVVCPSVMFRKKLIDEYSLRFRPEFGPPGDVGFWFEANIHPSPFFLINAPLLEYRRSDSQHSRVTGVDEWCRSYKNIEEFLVPLNIDCDTKSIGAFFARTVIGFYKLKGNELDDLVSFRTALEKEYGWFISDSDFNEMIGLVAFKDIINSALKQGISLRNLREIMTREAELKKSGVTISTRKKLRWAFKYVAWK